MPKALAINVGSIPDVAGDRSDVGHCVAGDGVGDVSAVSSEEASVLSSHVQS